MTIAERLKQIREQLGLSQEAIGAQGFVSTPGWIKLENGQRSPSEPLIGHFCAFLKTRKYHRSSGYSVSEELTTLKYCASQSPFVRGLALAHANRLGIVDAGKSTAGPRAGRGRPAKKSLVPA